MRVVHISAHADDENLGCGGTLLAHKAAGEDILWAVAAVPHKILTPPAGLRWSEADMALKARERETVAAAFGFADWRIGYFWPGTLAEEPTHYLVEWCRAVVRDLTPDVIYTVSGVDRHSDHLALVRALTGALPLHDRLGVRALYECETISASHWFEPTVWRDVTPHFARKLEIAALYASEMGKGPRTPEGIEAWGRFRGEQIGVRYAEAFRLVWEIR